MTIEHSIESFDKNVRKNMKENGGSGWARTTDLALIRRAL